MGEKYGIHPNMFYKWEKQLFEGAIFLADRKANDKEKEVVEVAKNESESPEEKGSDFLAHRGYQETDQRLCLVLQPETPAQFHQRYHAL